MKTRLITTAFMLVLVAGSFAKDGKVTIVAPTTEAGEGLDLQAVAELFKESKTIEEFERALNDPQNGVNNLDIDGDGYIDFIRVVDYAEGETHVFILQVPLDDDEFQDVATIEVERDDREYNMQIRGNDEIYGSDYYYHAPVRVHISLWPIITWVYGPRYRPYRSVYCWAHYPRWWRPWRAVSFSIYRARHWGFHFQTNFVFARKTHVHSARHIYGKPRSSHRATRKYKASRAARRYDWNRGRRDKAPGRRASDNSYRRHNDYRGGKQIDRRSGNNRGNKPAVRNKPGKRDRKSYGSRTGERRVTERNKGRAELRKNNREIKKNRTSSRQRVSRSADKGKRTKSSAHKANRGKSLNKQTTKRQSRSSKKASKGGRTNRNSRERR